LQGKSEHSSAPVKKLRELPKGVAKDKDRLLPLIAETVNDNSSVLVFCGGRCKACILLIFHPFFL